jgi:fibronectin type III domain protein
MSRIYRSALARSHSARISLPLGTVMALLVTAVLLFSSGPGVVRASAAPLPFRPAAVSMLVRTTGVSERTTPAYYTPPSSFLGPFNGTRFNASWDETVGVGASTAWIAVDPTTQMVFGTNLIGGYVSAWSEKTGQLRLESPQLLPHPGGDELTGVTVDPVHHRLWVAALLASGGGELYLLNETSLLPILNDTFPSTYNWLPVYLSFDPETQSVVASDNGGNVSTFNATTLALEQLWVCTVCSDTVLTVLGSQNLILVPSYAANVSVLNASTLTLVRNLTTPTPGFVAVACAYDSATGLLWVANYSGGFSPMSEFNLALGSYVGPVPGGLPNPVALVYDPATNVMALGSRSGQLNVATYNASTGVLVAHYSRNDLNASAVIYTLALDSSTDTLLLGSLEGPLEPILSMPTLTPLRTPFEGALEEATPASDPVAGMFYSLGIGPSELVAHRWSNGSVAWTTQLPSAFGLSNIEGMAADSGLGRVYVYNSTLSSFAEFNASTGAPAGKVSVTEPDFHFESVSIDSAHHWLYAVNDSGNVTLINAQSNIPVGVVTAPVGVTTACGSVADSVTETVYVLNCSSPKWTIYGVNGSTGALEPRQWSIGRGASSLALDPVHQILYVGGGAAPYNITVVPLRSLAAPTSFLTAGQDPTGLSDDPGAGLLFLTNFSARVASVYSTATGALAGTVPTLLSLDSLADPATGEVVVNQIVSEADLLLRPLALPSAPSGLALVPNNGSLAASWTAIGSPGSGNATITGYTASLGTSASGPWTANVTGQILNTTFTHLSDGTTYFVTVVGHTIAGTSPTAPSVSAVPVGVPYPPTSVSVTSTGTSSVRVSWGAPSSTDGAAIRNYTVEFATSATGPWSSLSAGTVLGANLTGLKSSTNYTVFVTAWNSVGEGDPSARVATSTSAPSSSSSPLTGSSLLYVVIGVVVLAAVLAAVLLLRRRPKQPAPGPYAPGPAAPPAAPAGGYGNVPPGVMSPPPGGPPSPPPPGA